MQVSEVCAVLTLIVFGISLMLSFKALSLYLGKKLPEIKSKTKMPGDIPTALGLLIAIQILTISSFLSPCRFLITPSCADFGFIIAFFTLISFDFISLVGVYHLVFSIFNLVEERKTLSKEDL